METKKAASHPDVPRPSNDELIELALQVCYAIEKCGASPELTDAVTLASDLHTYLKKPRSFEPYKLRVVGEKMDLDTKVAALEDFIVGEIFSTLPGAEQKRLTVQYDAMQSYTRVLGERIAAF